MRGVFSHEKQRTQTDSGMAKAMPLSVCPGTDPSCVVSTRHHVWETSYRDNHFFLLSSGSFLSLSQKSCFAALFCLENQLVYSTLGLTKLFSFLRVFLPL